MSDTEGRSNVKRTEELLDAIAAGPRNPSRKRVLKLSRGYFEHLISALTMANNSTDEQVKAYCGQTRHDAIQNVIAGMQLTLDKNLEPPSSRPR